MVGVKTTTPVCCRPVVAVRTAPSVCHQLIGWLVGWCCLALLGISWYSWVLLGVGGVGGVGGVDCLFMAKYATPSCNISPALVKDNRQQQ